MANDMWKWGETERLRYSLVLYESISLLLIKLWLATIITKTLIAATSSQELATSLRYVSSMASNAGMEIDQMIGILAVGSETTRLSAETIKFVA